MEELEKELESTEKEHLELKAELRVDEDKTLVDAVEELRRQQIEAVDKSIKRKAECENLEATNLELEGSVERQRLKIESFEIERGEEGGKLSGLRKEFEVLKIRCEQLSVSEKEGKDQSESSEKELKKTQQERNRLKETLASKSREKLEDERDRLTIVIAQLEEELHAANAMVQAFVTDGSSEKATEMAAQALRDEMEELKFQIDDYRRVSEEEKVAREAAELEIERLKEDVAALVSLGDKENASNEIQLRTAKATERLKRKERAEIEQLHKSLFRAMDELEVARAAEKSANEKLSKVRLQTSICEQEIMAAKSEVYFLTQAMEEMRLAEESKAASLEYRISSLEDENDVLRKYHAGDLDNARNELAQVTMEKDRILHQLKESEKTNASLVFAASKGESNDSDDTESLEGEITRLRVENAHLITVASDDKVRHERRLREALAAHAATAEADTILEHELRIAAEATIQTLKVELEDLRNEEKREGSPPDMDDKNRSIEELTNEIESLKFDFQVIQKENSNLKSKMEKAASKAKTQIDFITDDCRKAQAKAHKLEREGRYEAAVKSEVAKLRMPQGLSTPEIRVTAHDDWMLVSNAPAATDRFGPSLTNAEAFDLIRKQKEDIQEERTMYLEFLAEHDDLLALLAQHDLERTCLKEAMFEAGLQAAVDEAVRKAEEKSAEQYGRIIRIS